MSRVLVPYDQSGQADYALEHALSTFDSATVVLLHVVEPARDHTSVVSYESAQYPGVYESAGEMLDGVREAHDAAGRIETVVQYGRPAHSTLSYVDQAGIDHVVIGSHGRDGAARLLLGSVAETVARRSPVPVTIVRQAPPPDPDQVLVPFDGSTHSRRALTYALENFPETEITALYVAYPSTERGRDAAAGSDSPQGWADDRDDHAQSVLSGATELAADSDRTVKTRSAAGAPADTIVEFAEAEDAGHLVLGSAGRDGIVRLLLGSVAETVMRRSPVSVTIAK